MFDYTERWTKYSFSSIAGSFKNILHPRRRVKREKKSLEKAKKMQQKKEKKIHTTQIDDRLSIDDR